MKQDSLSSRKPGTRYYISQNTFSETSLVVASSFDSLIKEGEKTLEFLVFTWDDPADLTLPYIDSSDTPVESINELFEYRLAGPIKRYVLDKQYKYANSKLLFNEDALEFTPVERNIINIVAFPHGLRLLELIITATSSGHLRDELLTLRDFILLVNNPNKHN